MCQSTQVNLQITLPEAATRARALGAHCQCGARMRARAAGVRNHADNKVQIALRMPGQQRRMINVRVPLWVAYSCAAEKVKAGSEGLSCVPLRHQLTPEVRGTVRATADMYRPHVRNSSHIIPQCQTHKWTIKYGLPCPCTWSSRCQVPLSVYHVLGQLREGIAAGRMLVKNLVEGMSSLMGSVGVASNMRTFLTAASKCWDWQRLVFERPSNEDVMAFLEVKNILKPYVTHTLWPDFRTHPVVQKDSELRDRDFASQYLHLCWRVRSVAALAAGRGRANGPQLSQELLTAAKLWVQTAKCRVWPVLEFSFIRRLVTKMLGQPGLALAVAGRISLYLGELFGHQLPMSAFQAMEVRAEDLVPMGQVSRRKRQKIARDASLRPIMALQRSRKLVYVSDARTVVDSHAICLVLGRHPYFCTGAGLDEAPEESKSCFHAVRLHHRCRVMRAPESACEHLGSLAHGLWEPSQGLDPSSVVAWLFRISCYEVL